MPRSLCRVRVRLAFLAGVIGALTLCSCGDNLAPADPQALVRNAFLLQGVEIELLLPPGVVVQENELKPAVKIEFDREPRRFVRTIWIEASDGPSSEFVLKRELASGHGLRYSVDRDAGEGSGGTMGMLTGEIEFEQLKVLVRCNDQKEFASPDPTWCIAYLHYLKPVRAK